MSLNGDIERKSEFIQQTWMGSKKFRVLDAETDSIGEKGRPGNQKPYRAGADGAGFARADAALRDVARRRRLLHARQKGPKEEGVGNWIPEEKHTLLAKLLRGSYPFQ